MDEPLYSAWLRLPGMAGWSNIARDLDEVEARILESAITAGSLNIERQQEESNG